MTRATDAYDVLTLAMVEIPPACDKDERFTSDDTAPEELAPICADCPLLDLCSKYADLERPKAGVWAGKRYRTNKPKGKQ